MIQGHPVKVLSRTFDGDALAQVANVAFGAKALPGVLRYEDHAMADPAGAAPAALVSARQAVDTYVAPALAQIADGGLRDLVAGLLSTLQELLRTDAVGAALRRDPRAILLRVVAQGADYLAGLIARAVKEPALHTFLADAVDGVRASVAAAASGSTLSHAASSLSPRAVRALSTLWRELLAAAVKDADLAALIGSLASEALQILGEPRRWKELKEQGIGFFLGRVVPSVRDFAASVAREQTRIDEVLRGVVGSLLDSVGSHLSDPRVRRARGGRLKVAGPLSPVYRTGGTCC